VLDSTRVALRSKTEKTKRPRGIPTASEKQKYAKTHMAAGTRAALRAAALIARADAVNISA
jgi:hypothetical protein